VRAAGGDYVLVHDGVRPFFSDKLLERVIEATKAYGAALPVLPLSDTLFLISADGFIERAFDRRWIVHAQTPQGFERKLLCESLEKAQARGLRFTDEAGAVWAMSGVRAKWIEGEEWNIKITTPWDLQLAECIGRTLRV
jgi:2-C-methyl-D-erythritol 4-phosphate cytidylyltransferase